MAIPDERARGPACAVIGPWLYLTITIEQQAARSQVHLHPGGQGFWIARILSTLACSPRLVGPVGGEAGLVLRSLIPAWGVEFVGPTVQHPSPTRVHDRRTGDRQELVAAELTELDRHEVDDLYSTGLAEALAARAVVLTASGSLPVDAYRRFTHDLIGTGTIVAADMHGDALDAALSGGPLDVVKVSEDDLARDGRPMGTEAQAVEAALSLRRRGAATVVVARGIEPAVVATGELLMRVAAPTSHEVDHRGAGDSMSGATVAALLFGFAPMEAVRLGAAAGAGNVTRHGLGSGTPDLVERLAELVSIEELR